MKIPYTPLTAGCQRLRADPTLTPEKNTPNGAGIGKIFAPPKKNCAALVREKKIPRDREKIYTEESARLSDSSAHAATIARFTLRGADGSRLTREANVSNFPPLSRATHTNTVPFKSAGLFPTFASKNPVVDTTAVAPKMRVAPNAISLAHSALSAKCFSNVARETSKIEIFASSQ